MSSTAAVLMHEAWSLPHARPVWLRRLQPEPACQRLKYTVEDVDRVPSLEVAWKAFLLQYATCCPPTRHLRSCGCPIACNSNSHSSSWLHSAAFIVCSPRFMNCTTLEAVAMLQFLALAVCHAVAPMSYACPDKAD